MEVNTPLLLLGEPHEMPYGYIKPLTVYQYLSLESQLAVFSMKPLHMYYAHKKNPPRGLKRKELIKFEESIQILKSIELYEYLLEDKILFGTYCDLIEKMVDFKEGFFMDSIFESSESLNEFRDVAMKINFLKETKVYKDEELQKYHEIEQQLKYKGGGATIADVITTVALNSPSYSYDKIREMSVIQLHALYLQFAQQRDYETSTLFATVSETKIEHWSKHVDLFKSTDKDIKQSELTTRLSDAF